VFAAAATATEWTGHSYNEDCSFLNIFPAESRENEDELQLLLELNIIPRYNRVQLRHLNVDLQLPSPTA